MKEKSNLELLRIIENYRDYPLEHVMEAKEEIRARKLSSAQIQEAKELLRRERKGEQINEQQELVRESITQAQSISNKEEAPALDAWTGFLSFLLAALAIYGLYNSISYLQYVFSEPLEDPVMHIVPLAQTLAFPIGVLLFWRKASAGWLITSGLIAYYLASGGAALFAHYLGHQFEDSVELHGFELMEPSITWIYFVINIFLLYGLMRPTVLQTFSVNKQIANLVLGLGLLIGIAVFGNTL